MKQTFPKQMEFRYPWRSYQLKVLASIESFMDDNRLHIVAPPGSGKTVLGLKVAHFLNQPTLILSPSIAIRNQWKERLVQDFLNGETPDWISFDLENPSFVTISTYQALHAAYKKDATITDRLAQHQIKTIMVDECHHLQKEWWKSLIQTVETCEAKVVALTATPPYDVNASEWARYHQLCGEVDIEINVAELVQEKNLCPHQDYIYFSMPDDDEAKTLHTFQQQLEELIESMSLDLPLLDLIKTHPYLQNPEAHLESIYESPAYFSALMVILQGLGKVVPVTAIGIIGADEGEIPPMTIEWLELFLQGVLYHDPYFKLLEKNPSIKNIHQRIHRMGVIEKGQIRLRNPKKIDSTLRSSRSKLKSIEAIVHVEQEQLQEDLRMVVLSDYIRKEALPRHELDTRKVELIGVIPIFEHLRKQFPLRVEIAVLTGSLVIIPSHPFSLFKQILRDKHLPVKAFTLKPLAHDADYSEVSCPGKYQNELVGILTELFTQGGIHVLVGTKALLGEGWDAPAINSLVLATYVGSFVSSNQIRGRAIRTEQNNENKTSNIWHLVCVAPNSTDGGSDFQTLQRRFKSFYGLGFDQNRMVENGVDRLHLPAPNHLASRVEKLNQEMVTRARFRNSLRQNWLEAIQKGQRMVVQMDIPRRYAPRRQKLAQGIKLKMQKQLGFGFQRFFRFSALGLVLSIIIALILRFNYGEHFSLIAGFIGFSTGSLLLFNFPVFFQQIKVLRQMQRNFDWLGSKKAALNGWFWLSLLAVLVSFLLIGTWTGINFLGLLMLSYGGAFLTSRVVAPSLWKKQQDLADTENHLYKIALTVFKSLQELELIEGHLQLSDIKRENQDDHQTFYIEKATSKDQAIFLEALREVVDTVDNPRYLISVKRDFGEDLQSETHYAVPQLLGKHRDFAELFLKHWNHYIGDAKLIFTRKVDGRLNLLRAKAQNLNQTEKIKAYQSWR